LRLRLRLAGCLESLPEGVALFVGHHTERDVDLVHAAEASDGLCHAVGELGSQRATGDGEGDVHGDAAPGDVDATDHVEVDDAAMQLGVLHGPQGLDDLSFGDGH
jgi:hypothetical protein